MLRNIGSTWARTLITIGVVFWSKPFIAETLDEASDLWVTANAWVGFLVLIAAGVPMSTTRQVARRLATEDPAKVQRTVSSSAGIYLVLAALALLVGAILLGFFEWSYVRRTVQEKVPELMNDARWGFAILILYGALSFLAQLPYGIFNAHQDFVRTNAVQTGSLVLKLVLLLLVLPHVPTATGMCSIVLATVLFEIVWGRAWARRRHAGIRLDLSAFDRTEAREILNFSAHVLLLNLGIKLAFLANTLIIASFGAWKAPTLYEAVNSPLLYLFPLVIAVGQVMMPEVAKARERGDTTRIGESFLKWSRLTLAFGIYPLLYLAVLGPEFVARWMREPWLDASEAVRANTALSVTILAVGAILFLPARGLSMQVLMGLGQPRVPSLVFLGAGVLNCLLALALVRPFGMVGPATATAISMILIGVWLGGVTCRALGTSLGEYLRYVYFRPLLAALPVVALLIVFKLGATLDDYPALVLAGIAGGLVHCAVWAGFVLRGDTHIDLRREIGSRVPARWRKDRGGK